MYYIKYFYIFSIFIKTLLYFTLLFTNHTVFSSNPLEYTLSLFKIITNTHNNTSKYGNILNKSHQIYIFFHTNQIQNPPHPILTRQRIPSLYSHIFFSHLYNPISILFFYTTLSINFIYTVLQTQTL